MKKILVFVFLLILLTGCASQAKNDSTTTGEVLTGNIYIDADVEDFASSGGGIVRVKTISKEDAMGAELDAYKEFLAECVKGCYTEAYVLRFSDGTGIIYYGCDPINAVYGTIDYKGTLLDGLGTITPTEDGTYIYTESDK